MKALESDKIFENVDLSEEWVEYDEITKNTITVEKLEYTIERWK